MSLERHGRTEPRPAHGEWLVADGTVTHAVRRAGVDAARALASAAIEPVHFASSPSTDTKTLATRRSLETSTSVTVTNPSRRALEYRRTRERPSPAALAIPAAAAIPAIYYAILGRTDASWQLADQSNAAGSQATWHWPWWAILPIGAGSKQHGLHLPMATDQIFARYFARALADRIDALIWPTLSYGAYPAFVAYAGSVSLSSRTFQAAVTEIADALVGFGASRAGAAISSDNSEPEARWQEAGCWPSCGGTRASERSTGAAPSS